MNTSCEDSMTARGLRMITYVFEGLSAFRSKGCIVGVVVDGVGVCELQYFSLLQIAHEPTNHVDISRRGRCPSCQAVCRRRQTGSIVLVRILPSMECGILWLSGKLTSKSRHLASAALTTDLPRSN